MLKRPLEGPKNAHYWHILQTFDAAEIGFNRYVSLFPRASWNQLWSKQPNESEKTVYLTGGREVTFKSGFDYQNLRIETLHGAIIDECRLQNKLIWTQVIRPMLGRYKGWCDFYSTPNGFDWFYDLEAEAMASPEEWDLFNAPSTEAWWWTPEEIASAKRTMSESEFAQEIMAEFRDIASGKAYISFNHNNLSLTNPFYKDGPIHPMLGIVVGMDFNLSPMCWTLGQKRAEEFYWFDEVYLKGSHTQEAAEVLAKKIVALNHKPGVIICGDATAKAGQRAASGQSDYDIVFQTLDRYKIPWMNMTPESNPGVKDRVNTVNARLKDAMGIPHMWINPVGCPMAKRDFDRVVWKVGNSDRISLDQTKDTDLTHASDGIGYAICGLSPLNYESKLPTTRVMIR